MVRLPGLQQRPARSLSAPCPPGRLPQKLERPLGGARIGVRESHVGPALRIIVDSYEAATGGPGSGGLRRWILVDDTAGAIPLRPELKRGWQPEPAQTFAVTLVVKAP